MGKELLMVTRLSTGTSSPRALGKSLFVWPLIKIMSTSTRHLDQCWRKSCMLYFVTSHAALTSADAHQCHDKYSRNMQEANTVRQLKLRSPHPWLDRHPPFDANYNCRGWCSRLFEHFRYVFHKFFDWREPACICKRMINRVLDQNQNLKTSTWLAFSENHSFPVCLSKWIPRHYNWDGDDTFWTWLPHFSCSIAHASLSH